MGKWWWFGLDPGKDYAVGVNVPKGYEGDNEDSEAGLEAPGSLWGCILWLLLLGAAGLAYSFIPGDCATSDQLTLCFIAAGRVYLG